MTILAPYYTTADFRVALSSLADSTLSIDGSTGGFGDLGFAPLFLTWSLGDDKFDFTTGYMFTAPTGRYETGADDNIGIRLLESYISGIHILLFDAESNSFILG